MTVTGVLHLGISPLPLRINNAYWKYMTSASTIDGFTIVTVGMVALICGLIARRAARPLRLYAVAAALMVVGGGLWWWGEPDLLYGPLLAGLGVALGITVLRPAQH